MSAILSAILCELSCRLLAGQVVTFVMVMSVISLLSSMMAVYLDGRSDATRPSKWLRTVAFKVLARVFCLTEEVPEVMEECRVEPMMEATALKKEVDEKKRSMTEIGEVLHELQNITSYLKEKQRAEGVVDEWKLISKIIDRILFWCCFLITIIYSFYTMGVIVAMSD